MKTEPLWPATGEDEGAEFKEGWRRFRNVVVEHRISHKSNTLSCGNRFGLIGVESLRLKLRDRFRVWRLGKLWAGVENNGSRDVNLAPWRFKVLKDWMGEELN